MNQVISKSTLKRLPTYLQYLKALDGRETDYISATKLAGALSLGEVQVRKDLGAVSGKGRPKVGYKISELIESLDTYLGFNNTSEAIVVGCGKLGRAMLDYDGFADYGINLIAGFDLDSALTIEEHDRILPVLKMNTLIKRLNIKIGIICVPKEQAQKVAEEMIDAGILAIMNFAPAYLDVPKNIKVENMNIATALAMLAQKIEV
jgi:redox-sensing transcriptional repressor